jgi:hypothetical protein
MVSPSFASHRPGTLPQQASHHQFLLVPFRQMRNSLVPQRRRRKSVPRRRGDEPVRPPPISSALARSPQARECRSGPQAGGAGTRYRAQPAAARGGERPDRRRVHPYQSAGAMGAQRKPIRQPLKVTAEQIENWRNGEEPFLGAFPHLGEGRVPGWFPGGPLTIVALDDRALPGPVNREKLLGILKPGRAYVYQEVGHGIGLLREYVPS